MFGLERSFRSFTLSPFASALATARRMARPHLQEGGIVPHEGRVEDQNDDGDFVLPSDVREEAVWSEIQDRLRAKRFSMPKRSNGATSSLKTTAGGRVFVPADVVLLLGDGRVDRGKRVLKRIVNEVRQRRMLDRLPARSSVPNRRR